MEDEDFPRIGGTGSVFDLNDDDGPAPRLWGLRSVSQAAARALDRRPALERRAAGFVRTRTR